MTRARLLLLAAIAACGGDRDDEESAELQTAAGEETSRETTIGPVTATVTVTPAEPRLGDVIGVRLEVTAERGVEVTMPVFGDALGRFSIVGFKEDAAARGDTLTWSQDYRIQASQSGRLRIPPLRLTFVDGRTPGDAGTGERELLTEEIPIVVEAVLPDDVAATASLRPARGDLNPDLGPPLVWRALPWLGLGAAAVAIAALLVLRRRRRRAARPTISPYDEAMGRLGELEAAGIPDEGGLNAWYVELSGIVRRYLERRFGLRAPELTTEEFLREAQRSPELSAEHRGVLQAFLADCDRVKFAGYRPDANESAALLAAARRFVDDTRAPRTGEEDISQEAAA